MTGQQIAETLREMMNNWDATMAKVVAAYPEASDEARYEMCKAAFDRSLGL